MNSSVFGKGHRADTLVNKISYFLFSSIPIRTCECQPHPPFFFHIKGPPNPSTNSLQQLPQKNLPITDHLFSSISSYLRNPPTPRLSSRTNSTAQPSRAIMSNQSSPATKDGTAELSESLANLKARHKNVSVNHLGTYTPTRSSKD